MDNLNWEKGEQRQNILGNKETNAENKFGSNFGNKGTSTPFLVPPW